MNAKALKALRQSIAHWTRLASGKRNGGEGVGAPYCALCNLFWSADGACFDCPVAEKTGIGHCRKTPYNNAADAVLINGYDSEQFKAAAAKELAFLKSLLPKRKP